VRLKQANASSFAVILATRNRPQDATRAVRSILASHLLSNLTVIDQSDDSLTADALMHFAADPRLTVLKSAQIGLARARNLGWKNTNAELLAFTDDDCEASPDWLQRLAAALAQDERIAVAFGAVRAAGYDRRGGFVMAYTPRRFHVVRHIREKARMEGVGACMAVRRSMLTALDGFDEELGIGAPLCSAEDTDIAVRALLAGYYVCETPDAEVLHYGFRSWALGERVIHGYMLGLGAANAKMLRLGKLRAVQPIAELAWRWLIRGPVVDLNHRPPRLTRLRPFLRGFWAGLSTSLEANGHFALRRGLAEKKTQATHNGRA
jgi:glycosyltransferase involved in cell wall biosynthesis